MDKKQLIEAVAFHLQQLISDHATICCVGIATEVRECAAALGILTFAGAYDQETATQVLYT